MKEFRHRSSLPTQEDWSRLDSNRRPRTAFIQEDVQYPTRWSRRLVRTGRGKYGMGSCFFCFMQEKNFKAVADDRLPS